MITAFFSILIAYTAPVDLYSANITCQSGSERGQVTPAHDDGAHDGGAHDGGAHDGGAHDVSRGTHLTHACLTFPKLPLPSIFRKLKSSKQTFAPPDADGASCVLGEPAKQLAQSRDAKHPKHFGSTAANVLRAC